MPLLQLDVSAAGGMAIMAIQSHGIVAVGCVVVSLCVCLSLRRSNRRAALQQGLRVDYLRNSLVIMPLDRWSTITKKSLSLAVQLRGQIQIVHVDVDDTRAQFESLWQNNVVTPLQEAARAVPELIMLPSRGGQVLQPIAEYILQAERREPDRQIVVVVPQLAVRHWWQKPLHNHRSRLLKLILSTFGSQRIMIINVPWHL